MDDKKVKELEEKIARLTEQMARIISYVEDIKRATKRNTSNISQLSSAVRQKK
jgi:hypothetical protein